MTTESAAQGTVNDRIIYEWLRYAGRYDQKTVDQHIRAIRYMEGILERVSFVRLRKSDIARVRDDLKRRASPSHGQSTSKSTVKHQASHIRAFLKWLGRQAGYKRLPSDLSDDMDLPKSFFERSLPKADKAYATIEQAAEMVTAMPTSTRLERRDQAIVALAFLGALRADTLVSLLMRHIDLANCQIIQDASASRTKNGKSLTISWFMVPRCFGEIISNWVSELRSVGFGASDALFPPAEWLNGTPKLGANIFAPMRSAHAVTVAFQRASKLAPEAYTSHAAKHTIAALRDELPLTQRQRKAWSTNMGHENEATTEQHYGKITDEERLQLMAGIVEQAETNSCELTDKEKIALVDSFLNAINR